MARSIDLPVVRSRWVRADDAADLARFVADASAYALDRATRALDLASRRQRPHDLDLSNAESTDAALLSRWPE